MMTINSRCKSLVLALALLVSGPIAAFVSLPEMPTKSQIAGAMALMMYIRLITKGSSFDYKASDWSHDVKQLMSSFNVFDDELYVRLVKMFDKWCVGRQLKFEEIDYKTVEEDGITCSTLKTKKLKCSAFGLMGLFDAYVIKSLENLSKIAANLSKTQELTKGVFGIDLGYSTK